MVRRLSDKEGRLRKAGTRSNDNKTVGQGRGVTEKNGEKGAFAVGKMREKNEQSTRHSSALLEKYPKKSID